MKYTEEASLPAIRQMAYKFYMAYCANSDNLNFRGEQCPSWQDLPQAIRDHWCAVAHMALELRFE